MGNARLRLTLLWSRSTASPFLSAGRAWLPSPIPPSTFFKKQLCLFPDHFRQQCKVLTSAVMSYIGACCNGPIYVLTISYYPVLCIYVFIFFICSSFYSTCEWNNICLSPSDLFHLINIKSLISINVVTNGKILPFYGWVVSCCIYMYCVCICVYIYIFFFSFLLCLGYCK